MIPVGDTCAECGGTRSHLFRETRHLGDCPMGPRKHADRHAAEVGKEYASCPVHDYEPAIECPTCYALADKDDWYPEMKGSWQ